MIVENLSKKMATYLYDNTVDKEKYAYNKLYYGLQIIVNFLIVTTILFIITIIFGMFLKTLLVFVFIALLRQFSGGVHLKSSEVCAVVSVAIMLFIVKLPMLNYIYYLDYVSLIVMILYSPATFKVRYEKRKMVYIILKLLSISIVLLNIFLIKNFQVSFIFLIQALSVIYEHYKLKTEDVKK